VDFGSVPDLAFGAVLPVRHAPGAPREARLTAGTRRFGKENRYHYLPGVLGVPILGVLTAFGFREAAPEERIAKHNPVRSSCQGHLIRRSPDQHGFVEPRQLTPSDGDRAPALPAHL
jgi:hypothetical protein